MPLRRLEPTPNKTCVSLSHDHETFQKRTMAAPTEQPDIAVLIPALNEEEAIPHVLRDLQSTMVRRIVVVDNGSTDNTAEVARTAGAEVIIEPRRGYGRACLTGIEYLRQNPPEILVFLDGDYSDYPEEVDSLLAPILDTSAAFVIGSRILGGAGPKALVPQARFGNILACFLIRRLFGRAYTDLGPFRAIRWSALESIDMRDEDFGWTVEMQVKAAKLGIASTEVPVRYRARVGRSKISGTVVGSVRAGHKILWTIFRERYLV